MTEPPDSDAPEPPAESAAMPTGDEFIARFARVEIAGTVIGANTVAETSGTVTGTSIVEEASGAGTVVGPSINSITHD